MGALEFNFETMHGTGGRMADNMSSRMVLHGTTGTATWHGMAQHELTQGACCMDGTARLTLRGTAWIRMTLHDTAWLCMTLHGTAWL